MVPRGGIELSCMPLNERHFRNAGCPVYPSMYPGSKSHPACWCGDKALFDERRAGKWAVRLASGSQSLVAPDARLPGTLGAVLLLKLSVSIRRRANSLLRERGPEQGRPDSGMVMPTAHWRGTVSMLRSWLWSSRTFPTRARRFRKWYASCGLAAG
jgi:hypothetical protein